MTNLLQKIKKWKATAQIAHLVFANTQNINPKKLKEQFFSTHNDFSNIFITFDK